MKRLLSILLTTALLATSITPMTFGITGLDGVSDIDAPYGANYFADNVITSYGTTTYEKTGDAEDTGINDLSLGGTTDSAVYFGFEEMFDAVSIDVSSSISNGSYIAEYWDGSNWSTLVGENSDEIENGNTGSLYLEWSRPSDWDANTMDVDIDEDGNANPYTTDSLYFARLRVTSDYNGDAYLSQVGITAYNLVLDVESELGDSLADDAEYYFLDENGEAEIYNEKVEDGNAYFALDAGTGMIYTYDVSLEGFVTIQGNETIAKDSIAKEVELEYAYVITLEDEDEDYISSADVTIDENDCEYGGEGEYFCAVPVSDTDGNLEAEKSGYEDLDEELNSVRDDEHDSQVTETFEMEDENGNNNGDDIDLVVDRLYLDDDNELVLELANEGYDDVDDDIRVYTYLYVDGDFEWSTSERNESSSSYLNAGEDKVFYTGVELDDGDEYDVEVIVDYTDAVDETDEDNNEYEEEFDLDGNNGGNDDADLTVKDIYSDEDGDIIFILANIGDEDVDSGDRVYTKVYVDGDQEWSGSTTRSSSNYLNENEATTYNVGDLDLDFGDTYEIEVCVDTTDTVDEERENNNCKEEDIRVGYDRENGGHGCPFQDMYTINWAKDAVCELYSEGIVNGRDSNSYEPAENVTRAEFLKMLLLGADYGVYPVDSADDYWDVSEGDWFYTYVTYATNRGFVDGYDDGSFRPNDPINRAEAVVMMMNVAYEELWSFDQRDIPFWDVDRDDWYAYAVVIAYEEDVVEGYWDDSFRPNDNLNRAEAAVLTLRAMVELF
jgi:hypothetical protein